MINSLYNKDCLEGMRQYVETTSVDLILTDPPYEVNYQDKSKHLESLGKSREKQVLRDSHGNDVILDYDGLAAEMFRVLKDDTHAYVFCGDRNLVNWFQSMVKAGFKPPQILVWKKNITTFDLTFGHKYPENKEFILFFQKGWCKLNGYSIERDRFRSVLNFDSSDDTDIHSCAKPMDLLCFLIKASSNEGDVCLDPFMGSGNHVIAFRRLKRAYIGFELSKVYFDVIQSRIFNEQMQKTLPEVFV